MKSNIIKIIIIIIALVLAMGTGYQTIRNLTSSYKTRIAEEKELENSIQVKGIIYKDEQVLTSNNHGVVNYLYSNGAKVAANSKIAEIYNNSNDVTATEQIKKIDKKISKLEQAKTQATSQFSDISVIQKDIYNNYGRILNLINKNNFLSIEDLKENITFLFNEKQMIIGQSGNLESTKKSLEDEKNNLLKSISSTPQVIKTPISGYFADSVDGFEDKYTLNSASSLKKDELINNISSAENNTPSNGVGKIIKNPKLLFETIVNSKSMANVKIGKTCTLDFSDLGVKVEGTLTRLDINNNEYDGMAEFEINDIKENLANARMVNCNIIIDKNLGLEVPKSAIRQNDKGEAGVYIVHGVSMQFKKVDIIFENENYILSKLHTTDKDYLATYESVIIEGKDLYDNKTIK